MCPVEPGARGAGALPGLPLSKVQRGAQLLPFLLLHEAPHGGMSHRAPRGESDMTQIPCPNCGELLACREESIGGKLRCPGCRVMLQLDADADGRPAYGR